MHSPNRILVIRFSSIGDIVLTTPVVRCVKEQLGAEVHFLTKAAYAPVLKGNPYIDRIIAMREDIAEVLAELKSYEYDFIVDLHHNLRSLGVKRALRRPSAAFYKLNIEKWLMTNFKINRLPDMHIVDRYFDTVRQLGVQNDGKGLDFFIEKEDEVDISVASKGLTSPGTFIALAIGAGLPTKNLEPAQWLEVVKRLSMPVLLLGGPGDAANGEWLSAQADNCISLAGSLSIGQSASVISQSGALIAPDSGLMHIGAALKTPVVSFWGNTIPEFGMTPYYPEGMQDRFRIFQTTGLRCRPCSKIGYQTCPKGHFKCIRSLDPAEMADAVMGFVNVVNRGRSPR